MYMTEFEIAPLLTQAL